MKQDLNELVRRSIRKDFAGSHMRRKGNAPKPPHPKNTKRIMALDERCEYYRFRRFFIGRLVRIVEQAGTGLWVEFVHEGDRENLNNAAGWTNYKRKYLLQGAKFDD